MHIEHSSPLDCASIAKGDNRERSGFQQMRGVNRRARPLVFSALLLLLGLLFCTTLLVRFPAASVRLPAASAQAQSATIRFAVTGDYGDDTTAERDVANLVKSWNPDFVITVGDNNYPDGTASSIDANIGQYYHSFIFPYTGTYGDGATTNRFFPCLGNHDWATTGAEPYLDYFVLPNNERYYDFVQGPVHFYAIDSDPHEPDGNTSTSIQGNWLKSRMAASTDPWKLVYFHHPAYSSGKHGPSTWMQWPFQQWGATAVLSGHDHIYERLIVNGLPYFVDGTGGAGLYAIDNPQPASQVVYNQDHGAMLVEASGSSITFQFINRVGELIDSYTISNSSLAAPSGLTAAAVSSSQINLSWTDNSTNEDGFGIERCQGSGCTNFAQVAQVGANVTSYSNTGLPVSTTYVYRVRAFNSAGGSPYSNTAEATANTAPVSFSDNFDDGLRDPSKWNFGIFSRNSSYFDTQVQVIEQNGSLAITPVAAVTDATYNGYVSTDTWNLTVARQIAITAVRVELVAGTSEVVSAPDTALFDNFHLNTTASPQGLDTDKLFL